MNFFNTEPRMPWYGYLIANAIVWIMTGLVFYGTKMAWFSNVKNTVDRPGTLSLLIFIPLAFFLASLYDYIFDRVPVSDDSDRIEDEDASQPIPSVPAKSDDSAKKQS